jgi:uncharacterized integral membrane protein (TIGR00698 family)
MHASLAQPDDWLGRRVPGLLVAATVAVAASFMSEHYGASAMLFALLLGVALNFLSSEGRCVPGVDFAASIVLRFGVALLGLRITFEQVAGLGSGLVAALIGAMLLTIGAGAGAARLLGLTPRFGIVTGGAVAICGVSAALAIAAVLPRSAESQRDTAFAVIGVTVLSTVAMIVYPVIAGQLALGPEQAGFFLGGTIHDIAQVVGAGYGISPAAGDTATYVKLLRVAMLVPVILAISLAVRLRHGRPAGNAALLPWFVVVFAALAAANSFGLAPDSLRSAASEVSRWCLIVAIAAIGMKTQLKELASLGARPIILIAGETLVLAALVIACIVLR